MEETLVEMQMRHAREMAQAIQRERDKAYKAGQENQPMPRIGKFVSAEMAEVVEAFAEHHGISVGDMVGPSKQKAFMVPRWAAWTELRARGYSLTRIGEFFGRDHTTILSGIRKYEQQRKET